MKKVTFCFLLFIIFLTNSVFSQKKSFPSIQEALDYHVTQLKGDIRNYTNVFIVTSLGDSLNVSENVFQVENSLNAKFLNKKDQNFLVKLFIDVNSSPLRIDVANFRVVKQSNRKIKLKNLGNGNSYTIK